MDRGRLPGKFGNPLPAPHPTLAYQLWRLGADMIQAKERSHLATTFGMQLIMNGMGRDRFFRIRSNLTCTTEIEVHDAVKKEDRLWKAKPFVNMIRNGCLSLLRPNCFSIDEQMDDVVLQPTSPYLKMDTQDDDSPRSAQESQAAAKLASPGVAGTSHAKERQYQERCTVQEL
ncbi:hypothetical protein HPB47_018275 [Ixodes persulcatus]|uniref:Uncharacterized protein n=1 Tax=Ixodes persulcatus TaxID=34615 RepID=A0AC60QL70_IXOPE|nr:hypothetical protein HPB47_018275 [Ixodes persulcatus]